MRDIIEAALRGHDADFIDLRIEERQGSRISYRGRDLEDIGSTNSLGGNVRALYKGGWGFTCFNDLSNLREFVNIAVREARTVGTERSELADAPVIHAEVPAVIKKDPRGVSIGDKKRLFEQYNDIIWSKPNIQTSSVRYGDSYRRVTLANSEGTYIVQEKVDLFAVFLAVARRGSDVQQAFISLGSAGDYGCVENREQEVEDAANRAIALLDAKPVKGGEYTVVADPTLSGVFAHEAFGHLSEADFVYENERMKEIMVLGRRFGGEHLNIVDGAHVPDLRGSYTYDDEGVPSTKTYLIRDGVLVGRLHSRETAGKMHEQVTGNARNISYNFKPIVRMTNTYIEPRSSSKEDLFEGIKEGVYARQSYGGQTSMEMFTFSAGEAFMIRDGKIAEPVRNVSLSGNVFATLANIDMIANDLDFREGGGCGKGGQSPLPVSTGGPHIRIQKCVVGGE